jgi:hypothetical protein
MVDTPSTAEVDEHIACKYCKKRRRFSETSWRSVCIAFACNMRSYSALRRCSRPDRTRLLGAHMISGRPIGRPRPRRTRAGVTRSLRGAAMPAHASHQPSAVTFAARREGTHAREPVPQLDRPECVGRAVAPREDLVRVFRPRVNCARVSGREGTWEKTAYCVWRARRRRSRRSRPGSCPLRARQCRPRAHRNTRCRP